jgi:hypothetical protein
VKIEVRKAVKWSNWGLPIGRIFQKGAKLIGLMTNLMYSNKKTKKNHLKLKVINPIKVEKIAKVSV